MVLFARENQEMLAIQRSTIGDLVAVPYCTGGWNTRDPLPSMPIQDAVILDNYIVLNEKITSRNGFSQVASGLASNVESIFEFSNSNDIQLISCAGSKIYEGLSPSVVEIGTGFTSAKWQGFMMNQNLLLFNGADSPQKYDGTTLSVNTFTGTGLTPSNLVGGTSFKNRLIAWENNATGFWYGDSDAISGALDFFDVSFVTRKGGYVVACASWSYDSSGGTGLQARLVIFMSSGEALVYEGTNPGDPDAWAIVGRYRVAPPVSQRAILELSGDILIVNKYDLISFTSVMESGENPNTQSKLVGAISAAVASYGLNFGWQLTYYPEQALIILNVPTSTNAQYQQFVINTRSGGCSRFTGINARCFAVVDDVLYFGGAQKIYRGLSGSNDGGVAISLDSQSAFNTLGVNREKTLNYVKAYLQNDGVPSFSSAANYDFITAPLQPVQLTSALGVFWDTVLWDTSYWSPESEIKSVQFGVAGQGVFVSYRIKGNVSQSVSMFGLTYSIEIDKL